MSSNPGRLVRCSVCEAQTASQCGGCHGPAFCSRECQALVWATHKYYCKRASTPTAFALPPLTPKEAAPFKHAVGDGPKVQNFVSGEATRWYPYALREGIYDAEGRNEAQGMAHIVEQLQLTAESCRIAEPERTYLIALLQSLYFLKCGSTGEGCTHWAMCGSDLQSLRQGLFEHCRRMKRPPPADLLTRLNAFLQQDLFYHTLRLEQRAEALPDAQKIAVDRMRARAEELPMRNQVDKAIKTEALGITSTCQRSSDGQCVVC